MELKKRKKRRSKHKVALTEVADAVDGEDIGELPPSLCVSICYH